MRRMAYFALAVVLAVSLADRAQASFLFNVAATDASAHLLDSSSSAAPLTGPYTGGSPGSYGLGLTFESGRTAPTLMISTGDQIGMSYSALPDTDLSNPYPPGWATGFFDSIFVNAALVVPSLSGTPLTTWSQQVSEFQTGYASNFNYNFLTPGTYNGFIAVSYTSQNNTQRTLSLPLYTNVNQTDNPFNWNSLVGPPNGGTIPPYNESVSLGSPVSAPNFSNAAVFPLTIIVGNAVVPEPSTLVIWTLVGGLVGGARWHRRRKAAQ